jgi:hypothetical protein
MFNCIKPSTRYTSECAIYIDWHTRYHPAKLNKCCQSVKRLLTETFSKYLFWLITAPWSINY